MRNRYLRYAAHIGLLVLATSIGALAQTPSHVRFAGVINAYSPQYTTSTGSETGPYEVRGPWSLQLNGSQADFSGALNMVLSDGWVITLNGGNFDPDMRGAHTHHVTLVNAVVAPITNGFKINGTATITLNGSVAPISGSSLEVDITGGTNVKYSNITLTFGDSAAGHFGSEPLAGVVRSVKKQN